jgi:hypothetical protein
MEVSEMSFWADMDERAHRLGILDTKLSQAAAILVACAVIKAAPRIVTVNAWWFIGLAALCAIKPLRTFYFGTKAPAAGAGR